MCLWQCFLLLRHLHEKTASSPGQSLGGGEDKSGLVVNTESGVRGVAFRKRNYDEREYDHCWGRGGGRGGFRI